MGMKHMNISVQQQIMTVIIDIIHNEDRDYGQVIKGRGMRNRTNAGAV
jgi:hypothetical protein